MKTKQKMLTKPITAGFASIFYFKSVKDGFYLTKISGSCQNPVISKVCEQRKNFWLKVTPGV